MLTLLFITNFLLISSIAFCTWSHISVNRQLKRGTRRPAKVVKMSKQLSEKLDLIMDKEYVKTKQKSC